MSAPCPTFGFIVEVVFQRSLSHTAREKFWSDWRSFLNREGLRESRVPKSDGNEIVVMGEGTQATDADRGRADAWLAGRAELATVSVSALGDVKETV